MSIEAMKQALEALENKRHEYRAYQAITALRQAIEQAELAKPEQAEKQEPVAYKYTDKTNPLVFYFTERKGKDVTQNLYVIETALYTAPSKREWIGLNWDDIPDVFVGDIAFMRGAKWALAKIKEKSGV
jgi:hypothetical protein